jgi:hypothetical protein
LHAGQLEVLQQFLSDPAARGFDWSARRFRTLVNGHPSGLYDHKPAVQYPAGTMLHVAAWRGHADVVRFLLAQGASPTVRDAYDRTPADVAATPELALLLEDAATAAEPPVRPFLGCGCGCGKPLGLEKARAEDLEDGARECAVCLSTWSDGDEPVKMRPCGHYFCEECLGRWLQKHSNCPLCRAPLPHFRGCSAFDSVCKSPLEKAYPTVWVGNST